MYPLSRLRAALSRPKDTMTEAATIEIIRTQRADAEAVESDALIMAFIPKTDTASARIALSDAASMEVE